jgi:DNA polymerase-3 subunit gamma/tau
LSVREDGSPVAEDKQYQSLYRKYRPQGPEELLGQEHVVRALVGSINDGRLAHAFLFCGPRGTGKTSTARILAKMVNCEKGPTATPCGQCEQCVRIRDGSHLDVVEIDAASHGGVDDARELRERAPTAPAFGREKVYIIDEAQRLSREAFDALLKVFEEPPPGVRFVLCTTEPHRMPPTIVGRCQRFDFRRLSLDVLAEHLVTVAKAEGVALTGSAAMAMARQAEGSARDALSLLDQASVLGGESIDDEVLASLLGAPRADVQYEMADAISVGDAAGVFAVIDRMVQEGQDLRFITAETLGHFRNLLLANTAPGQADLVDVPEGEYERIRAQAAKFTPAEISRVVALLLAAQTDMRWTTSPRLTLELALVRSTLPDTDPAPEALIARIERLERLSGVQGDAPAVPAVASSPATEVGRGSPSAVDEARAATRATKAPVTKVQGETKTREPSPTPEPPPAQPVMAPSTGSLDVAALRRSWNVLIERLRAVRQPMLAALLETATPASFDGDVLVLAFPPTLRTAPSRVEAKAKELEAALRDVFGVGPTIRCEVREAVVTAGPESIEDDQPLSEEEALAVLTRELDAKPEGAPEPPA